MGYLISEMLPCLILAGLIGTILGWLLRKCKKRAVSYAAVSQKAVAKSTSNDIDVKRSLLEDEIVQLRLKLSSAELVAKTADMKLSAIGSDYDLKLKKEKESFYGRDDAVSSLELKLKDAQKRTFEMETKYALLEGEHASKLTKIENISHEGDGKVEALKEALTAAEASSKRYENELQDVRQQLLRVEKMHHVLEEEKLSFEKSYETMQEEYNSRLKEVSTTSYDSGQEMKSLHDKLSKLEGESLGFKSEKSFLEDKIKNLKIHHDNEKVEAAKRFSIMQSEFDTKLNQASKSTKAHDGEVQSLRDKLVHLESKIEECKKEKSTNKEIKKAQSDFEIQKSEWTKKLSSMENENAKLKEKEQSWKALKSKYESSDDTAELDVLKAELESARTKITTSQMKHKVIANDYAGKLKLSDEENEKLLLELKMLKEKPSKDTTTTDISPTKKETLKRHKHTKRLKKK